MLRQSDEKAGSLLAEQQPQLIWDELGMTLEEYAIAFNRAWGAAFEEATRDKFYLVSKTGMSAGAITNIGDDNANVSS